MNEEKKSFEHADFISHCMTKGFDVRPSDFGGYRIQIYASGNHGSKDVSFSNEVDMIRFIAELYGTGVSFGDKS